jgi:hypothetical protein
MKGDTMDRHRKRKMIRNMNSISKISRRKKNKRKNSGRKKARRTTEEEQQEDQ